MCCQLRIGVSLRGVTVRAGYDENTRKPQEQVEYFHDVLHESIREGMRNVLGETGMHAALFHLKSGQDPWRPKEFHDNLIAIFKDGAVVLEKIIVKELFQRCGLIYQSTEDFDFQKSVNLAREVVVTRMGRM